MRVLVIGGARGIGKAVAEKYGMEGHFVFVADNHLLDRVPRGKVVYRKTDFGKQSSLEKIAGDLDYDLVIDCAGFEKTDAWREGLEFFRSRCRQYILLLSGAAYAGRDCLLPDGASCEETLREEFAENAGCAYTIISLGIVYGKEILPFVPYGVPEMTDILLRRILAGEPIVISDGWEKKFPIMHECDFADGLYQLLQEKESRNMVISTTGRESVTPKEVLCMIADLWGVDIKTLSIPVSLLKKEGYDAHRTAFPFWTPGEERGDPIGGQEGFRSLQESLHGILNYYLRALSHSPSDREKRMDCIVKELEEAAEQGIVRCEQTVESPVSGKLYNLFLRKSFDCERNDKKFQILVEWMELRQRGRSFTGFFVGKGIRSIAIYGMGEIGLLLYKELQKESFGIVSYVIDKGGNGAMDSTPVFYCCAPNLPKVDAVVVTPVLLKKSEMDEIAESAGGEVFTIEEILAELKAESWQHTTDYVYGKRQ